jgi:glycosyltransferase involved in cell wall biosynthesis
VGRDVTQDVIVISAVNVFEGGPLSLLQDCLTAAAESMAGRYDIVALVHDATLFDVQGVRFVEFPRSRGSWLHRLYYEYLYFRGLSRRLKPYLWLSLHDLTPNVEALRRVVYCHNPAPFFKLRLRDALLEPRFALFNLLYGSLYRINIQHNDRIVVQQHWLASEFRRKFGVDRLVVAHPSIPSIGFNRTVRPAQGPARFIYPTFPRVFKNVEILGEAAALLEARGMPEIEFVVTIDGTENRYARFVRRKYGHLRALKLIGRKRREEVFELYADARGMVFPSRLETWGMPLTEFQMFGKPILVADLPYAWETIGGYEMVKFIPPDNAAALVDAVLGVLSGEIVYDVREAPPHDAATVDGWHALFSKLLG